MPLPVLTELSPAYPLAWGSAPLAGTQTVLVTIAGELDRDTAPGLRNHLEWLLAGDCRRLILDTSAVTFADLGAFDLLRAIGERAAGRDCRIVLTSAGADVRRLLELVGLPRGVELETW